jgi:cobalamin biosynthesis protein CobD/CbiB
VLLSSDSIVSLDSDSSESDAEKRFHRSGVLVLALVIVVVTVAVVVMLAVVVLMLALVVVVMLRLRLLSVRLGSHVNGCTRLAVLTDVARLLAQELDGRDHSAMHRGTGRGLRRPARRVGRTLRDVRGGVVLR